MDEKFLLFLNDVPAELQGFILEVDRYLTGKGSKRTIKPAKNGFVTSYSSPVTGKTLMNYVFRKSGMRVRIYAAHIGSHAEILDDLPKSMKADIRKGTDCKKLTGGTCSPTCPGGYAFVLDGEECRKCKNSAFFHSLTEENLEPIMKLIKSEVVE